MKKMFTIFIILILNVSVFAYSGGPPNGRTGAPGELTCQNGCHSTFPLNSGDGSLGISGPEFFTAGQTYTITVELDDPGQSRWGFEFTQLDQGSITITDDTHTQMDNSGDNTYVKHTSMGTYANMSGPVSWEFDWTAPDPAPSQVMFYAAGNGANNNGNNSGDYIYTTSFTTTRATTGVGDDPFASLPTHIRMSNYPNPFNAQTTISYDMPVAGHTTLEIYNLNGQLIERLVDNVLPAGEHSVVWNANNVSSGVYLYRLSAGGITKANKMILIK